MHEQWIGGALLASLAITLAGTASAQQLQPQAAQPSVLDQPADTPVKKSPRNVRVQAAPPAQTDPNLDETDQLAPSQMNHPIPGAVSEPTHDSTRAPRPPSRSPTNATANAAGEAPTAAEKPARMANTRTVACSGAFAKDSSSLKLAMVFDSRNISFTEVDASGSKVAASVLFAKDPKHRLEVWWSNPANRSQTYLILINGQSTWTGPGGMRLGLTLAQLEKLNHKPFKLKGFSKDNVATVSDWDGGALADLAGGCKSGVSLSADSKAPAEAVSTLASDHEYSSSDPAMLAVKPTVSEILIGY
jgi:hypothetical protein